MPLIATRATRITPKVDYRETAVSRMAFRAHYAAHSYVVRKNCRCDWEFQRFVMHIRSHGYRQKFGRSYYTCFDWPVDGVIHKFWTMGAPLQITIIINRAVRE